MLNGASFLFWQDGKGLKMVNCKNCGAPIIFGMLKCPYCETPFEAPGGSETAENFRREVGRAQLENSDREVVRYCLDDFDADFNKPRTLRVLETAIGSRWDVDEDFEDRTRRYLRGEKLEPKWMPEEESAPIELVHIEDRSGIWEEVKKIFKGKKPKPVNTIDEMAKYKYMRRLNELKGEIE